eukprot:NODE_709_length_4544_cov_1.024072.p5 type:complete len:108 gc:universal NODE_709_length_4544_cov_1.024072:2768-2445(-)
MQMHKLRVVAKESIYFPTYKSNTAKKKRFFHCSCIHEIIRNCEGIKNGRAHQNPKNRKKQLCILNKNMSYCHKNTARKKYIRKIRILVLFGFRRYFGNHITHCTSQV